MSNNSLRKLCPNLDKEDGLDTVLEVPIPEEMYTRMGDNNNNIVNNNNNNNVWDNMLHLMRFTQRVGSGGGVADSGPRMDRVGSYAYLPPSSNNDQFMLLLKLVGSALIPSQVQCDDHTLTMRHMDPSIETSTAKYIVQQYLAATGGLAVLSEKTSMYAVGKVEMNMVDNTEKDDGNDSNTNTEKNSDVGGFVLWQKNPDLWYLELVVSGCKISGGSDGKVSWNQSSSNSVVSKGPPRPLRRFFQGLDPRSTAHLFLNAGCIGEKMINGEDCFILKHETSSDVLKLQSTTNTEVSRHTIWGYFSQRSGLLIQFEDTKLVRMKNGKGAESVFWETNMESILEDYRYIEGINISHRGKTNACIYRYGDRINTKWRLHETWNIEEVDFNICGLSMDCFLSPADDIKKENQTE